MDFFSDHKSQIDKYLTKSEILTLQLLIWLLQVQKDVRIERLASCREFHSIELSYWLKQRNTKAKKPIYFALREKNNIYMKRNKKNEERLKDLKLTPGVKVLHKNVKLTRQKGFGKFNLLTYKKRDYRYHKVKESWLIITNLSDPIEIINLYKKRAAIEALQ